MKQLERHPLSAEYPDITGQAWKDYVANVREFGIVGDRKIVLYEGKVVDGWQLYRACLEAGIEPEFTNLKLPKGMTLEKWVEILNDCRRHESQAIMEARAAKRRERVAAARSEGKSTRAIAEQENVSQTTVLSDLRASGEQGVHQEPPDGKVTDKRGRQQPASKPSPRLCGRCQRNIRIGKQPEKNCKDCRELNPKKSKKMIAPKGAGDAYEGPDESDAAAKKLRDGLGTEVPKKLRDTFSDRFLPDTAAMLAELPKRFKSIQSWAPYVKLKEASEQVEVLVQTVRDGIPFAVHLRCDGKGCKECRQSGYVSQWRYEELRLNGDW